MQLLDKAALELLETGCERSLSALQGEFSRPIMQLTALGDTLAPHDLAFAATRRDDVVPPTPGLQMLFNLNHGCLSRLFNVQKTELNQVVGASTSVRCFFQDKTNGAKKDLVVTAGTTLGHARKAVGWLFDHGGEQLDFGAVPDSKVLVEGETLTFAFSAGSFFGVLAKPEPPQVGTLHLPTTSAASSRPPDPARPDHVVVLMLENRSFDHLLGKVALPADHPGWHRYAGQLPDCKPCLWPDPDHDVPGVQGVQLGAREPATCGFCKEQLKTANFTESYRLQSEKEYSKKAPATGSSPVSSYTEDHIQCMAHLAREFTTCDEWYSALAGPTVPNRMLFLTCATPENSHHNPEGGQQLLAYIRGMSSVPTLFNKLDTCRHVLETGIEPWRVYYEDTPLSIFLSHLKGTDHANFRKFDRFKEDVAKNNLPLFTFIEPRYYDRPGDRKFANDFHPPHNSQLADELVETIYNTLQSNPQLNQRTLFIITFDEAGGTFDHVNPPVLANAHSAELSRIGFRVPTIFVSPSVPKRSTLRRDGVHGVGGARYAAANAPDRVLSHCSLSATFHEWYGTALLNERDAGAATFCSVWQPAQAGVLKGPLPALPFKVNVPRNADGRPVEWAPYPETGIYLYAECLVADLYLDDVRPTFTESNDVSMDFVAASLHQMYDLTMAATNDPAVSPTLIPFLKVARYALGYLAGLLAKPGPSRVAVEKESFFNKLKKAIPRTDDIARLIPPRILLLFIMRIMYLPLVWMNRLYGKHKPDAAVAAGQTVVAATLPATERRA